MVGDSGRGAGGGVVNLVSMVNGNGGDAMLCCVQGSNYELLKIKLHENKRLRWRES